MMQSPCLHLCKTSFTVNHRLGFHYTLKSLSTRNLSLAFNFRKLNSKSLTTQCQNKPRHRQNASPREGVKIKGKKENVWSIDNDMAKSAAEKEKGRTKPRRRGRRVVRRKRNRDGRIMVSGAMLMEVETVLQTQEPVIRPAWNTFASSVSGIWKGVGAVFSPITAEMEPIDIGSRNEHLYDCYTLSHIEVVSPPSEGQISQIQRKINWVNPYGAVLQHVVGSNRIKEEDKTVNASLPPNQRGDLGTSRILPDFKSFDFEKSDLLEEDAMGNEPGLVFFEDGSYSRGPVNIPVGEVDDSKYYLTPTSKFEQCLVKGCHKRLRIVHTIEFNNGGSDIQIVRVAVYEEQWVSPANIHDHSDLEFDLKPFSQRKRTQPSELTGSWKVFGVNATPVFGDEMATVDSNSAPYVYLCTETLKKRSLPENPNYFGEEEMVDMQDVTVLWLPGGVTGYVDVNKDGILCIGVGWYSDEGINLVMERDYGLDGMLKEVRWKSELKRRWSDLHLM
ncbi:uncharacterized protein LOC131182898 [Hevea brasiliensis]|uniref:uncharacterized protein LOC131182898 n=1 Tax=Hevea brasiliensis TaxID=3981 RepID=UPI0025CE0913|nr:uncharacterized protein LOC131182898 [Hevea brasiliensis]